MDYKNIKTIEDAASAIGVKLLTEEEHGMQNDKRINKIQ